MITVAPSFATGIAKDVNPADCNSVSLGTTSGTSNLQAAWKPNTLNVEWYNGDTRVAKNTCNYDSGITVPATNPTKEGFAFVGWTIRDFTPPVNVGAIDPSIRPNDFFARGLLGSEDVCYLGESGSTTHCSDSSVSDISLYEWKGVFNYGTVYGTSICSSTDGYRSKNGLYQPDYTIRPDENTEGSYCYCKITGYTPLKGEKQNINNSEFVLFANVEDTISGCKRYCSMDCARELYENADFRTAVFETAQ